MIQKFKKCIRGVAAAGLIMAFAMPVQIPVVDIGAVQVSAEMIAAQGKCGDYATYKYDSDTKTITVSGTGDMWDDSGFSKSLKDTENIVIEKGIKSIGAYSFNGLWNVKKVTIADTVTTIKKHAFPNILESIEIPASVTRVEEGAVDGANKIIVKGNVEGYAMDSIGYSNRIEEIVLYGNAADLAKALMGVDVGTVTIAKENTKCKISNGCLLSSDGKTLYKYIGEQTKLRIPDTVVTISDFAFYEDQNITELTLGKNVKEIGAYAFKFSELQKINVNKKLNTIKTGAFNYSGIKKIKLKSKVNIGLKALDHSVTIKYSGKFKKTHTAISRSEFYDGKYSIEYAKVSGANGYEIKVYKGKKVYKYTTTKSYLTKKAPSTIAKNYNIPYMHECFLYDNNKIPKGAYFVSVRPYKTVKGKKIYGKWSEKSALNNLDDDDE